MIRLQIDSFTHAGTDRPVLRDIDLGIDEGELCLVIGPTGSGKSTLLGTINGLVPHFTGGHLTGRVVVDGLDTREHKPRDMAETVGYVGQDPLAGFVTDTVEEELAYSMEQLGIAPDVMRKRVEETLDLLGIADLRARSLRALSGGQQQRVAIGSVLTAHPRVLVLDEPTSALDPTAAEDVLAAVTRLVHDLGVTVVLAEHRLERVVHHCDRVVLLCDGTVVDGDPHEVLLHTSLAPPVVQLAKAQGWSPPPLSVREARRRASDLRAELDGRVSPSRERGLAASADTALAARGITVVYDTTVAVREVDLDLHRGEVVALMGRNGSGKSSFLWAIQGSGPRLMGRVEGPTRIGLVPQAPSDLLYLPTVAAECAQADDDTAAAPGTCRAILERLAVDVEIDAHPRDLSEGQRLALVLALQLTAAPEVILLDEPTRGLDPSAKERFAAIVTDLAAAGHAIVIATHDVELVATVADRVVVLAEGEVVADGPTADVVCSSPAFAPQVAKILHPSPWLTVREVEEALA
ncbi:MAG TPA: ATP-binding cassette domain-containing protein [Acidimicrobiales bacterium]|nr:ATP-binding cassette domain-containing protein [Acidimicrobiales bacterium]